MKYTKLTNEQVENVQPGDKVNFGNGNIVEIVRTKKIQSTWKVYDPQTKESKHEEIVKVIVIENWQEKEYYLTALKDATMETLDPTIKRCRYCGALRPAAELAAKKIWENRSTRTDDYCIDDGCAGYAQMAAEG